MIDVLLSAEIDGEKLSFEDVVSNAMLLVQAGLETTASAMSLAFHYLATHPDERDRLVREPEILPRAVEEFIRFSGSIHGLPRTVATEVELSGHTFCPGESVLVNYASANRDAAVFPEPDRCILDRHDNRHLGFGAGVHRCLGSNLARLEFHIGLEQVLSRMPDYTLAPGSAAVVPWEFRDAGIPLSSGCVQSRAAMRRMTAQEGSQLHHVVFAVAPERHDAVAQMFTDLGFTLQPAELTEFGLRIQPGLGAGHRNHQSRSQDEPPPVATSVAEFLDQKGDGMYTW